MAVAFLAACSSSPGPSRSSSSSSAQRAPEPAVDMACVERARNGHLLDGLPASASGFAITAAGKGGAHLHRDGRKLTDAEGAALWQALQDVFTQGGLSMGSSGMYSIYRCDDAAPASCFKFEQWVCRLSVDVLAARVLATLEQQGLADAEVTIDTVFNEAGGPRCRGDSCRPQQHYSTHGTYDAWRRRRSDGDGYGTCTGDGDCSGSQSCMAWYLLGGGETAEFRQMSEPTWCGCIDNKCTWFTQ
ncbi:MAG: hypothetical protein HOV81_33100 [Kofleriaceae bacterium]|nr:hypothetical protein [Kofleriaceae bacterium]